MAAAAAGGPTPTHPEQVSAAKGVSLRDQLGIDLPPLNIPSSEAPVGVSHEFRWIKTIPVLLRDAHRFIEAIPESFTTRDLPRLLLYLSIINEERKKHDIGRVLSGRGAESMLMAGLNETVIELQTYFQLLQKESGDDVCTFFFSDHQRILYHSILDGLRYDCVLQSMFPDRFHRVASAVGRGGIGRGHGGVVQLFPGTVLAEKLCKIGKEQAQSMQRELFILSQVRSSSVPTLRFFTSLGDRALLYTDFASSMNLEMAFSLSEYTSEDLMRDIWNILDAVSELHRLGYYHADIKPPNLLRGGFLIDFGSAQKNGVLPLSLTLQYHSPELVLARYEDGTPFHGKYHDMWQIGMVLFEGIAKKPFFEAIGVLPEGSSESECNTYLYSLVKGAKEERHLFYQRVWKTLEKFPVPQNLKDGMYSCLNIEPESRPTADELREILHPMMM